MNESDLFFNIIKSGNTETIEAKLNRNPDLVNIKDSRGFTPLIFASYFDSTDAVKLLVDNKAPIDGVDASGNTALIGVAFKGNVDLAGYLIEEGANINAKNNNGVTPLIFATMYNQVNMVELLLKKDADKLIKDNDGKIAIDYAKEKGFEEILKLLNIS